MATADTEAAVVNGGYRLGFPISARVVAATVPLATTLCITRPGEPGTTRNNQSPSWRTKPEFASGIDRMDRVSRTPTVTQASWEVMVGDGERFIVTATGPQRVANAITTNAGRLDDADTVDLTVGGQAVDYPASYALTRSEVDVALADLADLTLPASRWED